MMNYKLTLLAVILSVSTGACRGKKQADSAKPLPNEPRVDRFSTPALSPPLPADWNSSKTQRAQAKKDYIATHQVAYDWFGNFAFSEEDGAPYLILQLMPVIAPKYWGGEDNFLAPVGLFKDERQPDYPMARGMGFSGLARDEPDGDIDYVSFTCGACHFGRVKLDDGTFHYIDGGVNTEFNVASYRTRVYQTLQKVYGGETSKLGKLERANKVFTEALDTMHLQNPNFFYKNYSYGDRKFDAAYEAAQVKLFKKHSRKILTRYLIRAELEFEAYKALVDKNYQGIEKQMLAGMGGMVDATGINLGNVYMLKELASDLFESLHLDSADPVDSLPPTPGLTDIMAVWEQGKRKAEWNQDKTALIKGAGQWNGNIPIPMYRNLIASLTMGLWKTDVRVSVFGEELLEGLPADPYPFDVDLQLAAKGRALYQEHCVDCHRPHNGTTYENLGTDLSRAYVVDASVAKSARALLAYVCSAETVVDIGNGPLRPCAEFAGVSLVGREQVIMSPINQHWGYNALPLGGVWAQAPYLHTGSVPTLYHLLVVDERPDQFIKGRLDYDKEKVGFAWQPQGSEPDPETLSYVYDTTSFKVLSKHGHDRNITQGDKTYKLNWSDDILGARAIVEYMKTL